MVYEAENFTAAVIMKRAVLHVSAMYSLAGRSSDFTTDEVWTLLDEEHPDLRIRDKRAMGAIMRDLSSSGLIFKTGDYRPSTRRHGAPLTVWRRA